MNFLINVYLFLLFIPSAYFSCEYGENNGWKQFSNNVRYSPGHNSGNRISNEQEDHLKAFNLAFSLIKTLPQNDDCGVKRKKKIFRNHFNHKYNELLNLKILENKLFTKKKCQDKFKFCDIWKENDFCQSTFYSKSYRNHICAKSCGFC
uniref:ShKT domain-containing protein n=1 Tax=Parastrongyloides trichosuri TaxID=131310 RepID=A0A0N4ZDP7_PARTI